jgi:LacI family transcriptional regulator
MKITIKDVAKMANVSVATASLALNGKQGVNQETRSKVREAAKKLNYYPNHYARSLITQKSSTLGLIATDIKNPFFGHITDIIQRETEQRGYNLLLGISNDKITNEKKHVDEFIKRNVEGILVIPAIERYPDLSHLYDLKRLAIPFVFLTTAYRGIVADCVMTDLAKGSYELTKHLLQRGHRTIYFILGYKDLLLSSMRLEGYIRAFSEMGLDYRNDWIIETYPDFEHGYEITCEILKTKRPDAIITVNDILAMGVLKSLKDHRVKVPEDVSVAGYDDLLFSSIVETPLTTVQQPVKDICIQAVDILLDRIRGSREEFRTQLLAPKLIVRDSTK